MVNKPPEPLRKKPLFFHQRKKFEKYITLRSSGGGRVPGPFRTIRYVYTCFFVCLP